MEYGINKGIGKSVEFRGLKAQYLFIFAGGLLAVFVVFVILYMAGVDQWVCIAFGVAAASVLFLWDKFPWNLVFHHYTSFLSSLSEIFRFLTHIISY